MWNDGPELPDFMGREGAPAVACRHLCSGGGGGGSSAQDPSYYANIEHDKLDGEARARRQAENDRQSNIRTGTAAVNDSFDKMFTSDFYNGQQKNYTDYYKPQLDDQFADSQKKLTYWLSDRGLLDSSTRNDKKADLTKMYDTDMRQINNSALDLTNKTKSDVAGARAGLIGDVTNGADPGYAGTAASSAVQSLSLPPTYNPIGDMFGSFTGALATQAAAERAASYSGGAYSPAFNTGLFGGNRGSVRVVS